MFPGFYFYCTSGIIVGSPIRVILRSNAVPVAARRKLIHIKSAKCFKSSLSGQESFSPYRTSTLVSCHSRLTFRLFQISNRRASKILSPSKSENFSLGARLKRLSREYGWSAFGVYLALSALDFPLCYLLVSYLGADKIGEWEQALVSNLKQLIPEKIQKLHIEWRVSGNDTEVDFNPERKAIGQEESNQSVESISIGTEEAKDESRKDATALTPKIVRMLRRWGWDIGKRAPKKPRFLKRDAGSTKVRAPRVNKKT